MQTITIEGLDAVNHKLKAWASLRYSGLLEGLAGLVENQTKTRIADEQISPDGQAWPQWSSRYAKTRHGSHRLLQNTGHLFESIHAKLIGQRAVIGTNLTYAKAQQDGNSAHHLPARAFLGVSQDNTQELQQLVDTWISEQFTKH